MNSIEANAHEIVSRIDFDPLSGRSVLVTGGSGLLGTQIVACLSALPIDLHVQVQTGLSYLSPGPRTTLHYANLANPADCERLPQADVVISAHSYAQPLKFLEQPLLALRSAGLGTLALLERVRPGGRFLYISSSEVYCDSPYDPPYTENQTGAVSPYHPRACYITGKLFGEAMTYLYRSRGISTVAVRPGITYGPGWRAGDRRSWAQFVERALQLGKIELLDAGTVRRTFCYITDGIELLFKILLQGREPVYNLAGRDTLSIAELAQSVGRAAGVPVIIPEADHGVAGTPEDLQLDTALLDRDFPKAGWTNIEQGIAETVVWARQNLI